MRTHQVCKILVGFSDVRYGRSHQTAGFTTHFAGDDRYRVTGSNALDQGDGNHWAK